MPIFNNILAGSSGQGDTGYDIDQSVRLDNAGADNPGNYLARMEDVWTTDGNQKTWTISWWMKWDNEDSNSERWIYHVRGDIATSDVMGVDAILLDNEQLHYYCYTDGFSTLRCSIKTNRVFRDPSAWYHCMIVMDSTLAAAADRTKFYVNGVRETSFATDTQIPQDQATNTNMNANTYVGASMGATSTQSFGGYLAEFHRVDGQALGPASFGETNADTNQWVPVEYSGSYGTNGFYQKYSATELAASFTDSSSSSHTITAVGDVANTRAQAKIGSSSIYFDGTGDALTIPGSSDFQFGTGNFTIECWHYAVGTPGSNDGIISWYEDNTSGPVIEMTGAQYQLFEFGNTGTHQNVSAFTTGQWNHIALVRNSAVTKFYLNGSETYSVSDTQNYDSVMGGLVNIGRFYSSGLDMNGYLDEIRISDSARYTSAFTPSTTAFTADANTMLLIHSDFNGGLGADSSGNKNDFTPTNLVATDQVLDSPTRNYCTLNPLDFSTGTLSEGNLKWVSTGAAGNGAFGSFAFDIASTDNKYYFEVLKVSGDSVIGVVPDNVPPSNLSRPGSYTYYADGDKYSGVTGSTYGASYTDGDIISVAVGAGSITFYKNGASQGVAFTGLTGDFKPALYEVTATFVANFGQDSSFAGAKTAQGNGGNGEDFFYTPPTGYKALNSSNLDDPAIALPTDHFDTTLYSGTAATHTISSLAFQPDFLWIKARTQAYQHSLRDSIRGSTKTLRSNDTTAEETQAASVTSFNSDGWSMGADPDAYVNYSTSTYVGWAWKAASSNTVVGAGSIDGSNPTIATTRRTNTTAGFSIISFTGNGSAGATIAHGLSQAPEFWITKNRDSAYAWFTGTPEYPAPAGNYYIQLDATMAAASNTGIWNGALPSSTVITLGNLGSAQNNSGDAHIAYAFHSVEGYSKVGSYTGNGSADGAFVYTGFKPAFLLIKRIAGVQDWMLADNKISPHNQTEYMLRPAQSAVEQSGNTIDILSNGFKLRLTGNAFNASGESYLVLAIAESPFKTSNAR